MSNQGVPDIGSRKADHIDLCATGDVGFHSKTTLFEQVELIHDAMPELDIDSIDASVTLFGKTLRAPIVVAAMTGGTAKARDINRELASIAEEKGYGFGFGSQRPMLRNPADDTYLVRDVAPNALLLGNIGVVQAREMPSDGVAELAHKIGADAMCVHMNPAMEIVQPGGDRDFRGALDTMERLVNDMPIPVVAKETGCGIGPRTARRLGKAGIRHLDVSGAGGTSWVAVETARASADARSLGEALREWGVPTAASVVVAREARPRFRTIIATGGVMSGIDAAKAIALGAHAAGIARPVLQALLAGGREGAVRFLAQVEAEIRAVMLLVGAGTVADLRHAPTITSRTLDVYRDLARSYRKSR